MGAVNVAVACSAFREGLEAHGAAVTPISGKLCLAGAATASEVTLGAGGAIQVTGTWLGREVTGHLGNMQRFSKQCVRCIL